MAKLSHAAVVAAIRRLAALNLKPRQASAVEAFLVAKRCAVKVGATVQIKNIDEIVKELFLVIDDPNGRIAPFVSDASRSVGCPKWQKSKGSGQMTVWNVTTRGDRDATAVFRTGGNSDHPDWRDIRSGLELDAAQRLAKVLGGPVLPRVALVVFLARDAEFLSNSTDVESKVEDLFKITSAELDQLCLPEAFNVDLWAPPAWDAANLPSDLRPQPTPQPVPATAAHAVTPSPDEPMPPEELLLDDRVLRMVKTALRAAPAVILVGPPGTGKTALWRNIIAEAAANPEDLGFDASVVGGSEGAAGKPLWATPDESWTARELVGGETLVGGDLKFRPGCVLRAIEENRWLVLDEANRADLDKIFGGLLTWLAGRSVVRLGMTSTEPGAVPVELGWNGKQPGNRVLGVANGSLVDDGGVVQFLAGRNWRLLGTYNALDAQRVFRFGHALGRRFLRVPIPPLSPEKFDELLTGLSGQGLLLAEESRRLYAAYHAHHDSDATQLGHALFLSMAGYLRAARAGQAAPVGLDDEGVAPATTAGPSQLDQVVAEAYVVNVGTWVARLDTAESDGLGKRLVDRKALTEKEWQWVKAMVPSLG